MAKHFSLKQGAALVALSALFLTGCVATPPSTVQKDTIKIGVVAPLTGDAAPYGEVHKNVVSLLVEEANKAGGINGQQIELDMEDGQCNGKDATTGTQKLINVSKVQLILGPVCSGEMLAMAPLAQEAKVVVISGSTSSPNITNAGDYIFRTYPSDTGKGKVLAQYAIDKKFKKVGVIAEQSDYALAIKDVFVDYYKVLTKNDAEVQTYSSEATDMRTQITKLKEAGVEALFIDTQTASKAAIILQEMKELKFEPELMTQEVLGSDIETLEKYKAEVEGMITADVIPEQTAEWKKFKEDYKAKYGKEVNFEAIATSVYDATTLVLKALKEVGNDGTKIRDYLAPIKDYKGITATFSFDQNGDPTLSHGLLIIKDAKPVPYVKVESAVMEKTTTEE